MKLWPFSQFDDHMLIKLLKSSDATQENKALDYIYKKYHGEVFAMLRNWQCKNKSDDIFQESVIALYRRVKKAEVMFEKDFVIKFLKRVAKNLCSGEHSGPMLVSIDDDDNLNELQDDNGNEEKKNELINAILENLLQLGDSCKSLLELFYIEDLSYKEIGILLNRSPDVLRDRKPRCIRELREKLKKQDLP